MERMKGSLCSLQCRHAIEPTVAPSRARRRAPAGSPPHRSGPRNARRPAGHLPSNATARSSPACPSRYAAASPTDIPSRARSSRRASPRAKAFLLPHSPGGKGSAGPISRGSCAPSGVSFKSPPIPPKCPECCGNPRLLCRGTSLTASVIRRGVELGSQLNSPLEEAVSPKPRQLDQGSNLA